MHMLTKPQVFYDDAHKTALGHENPLYLPKAQQKQPVLYNANVLAIRHDPIFVCDSEETLILAKESRLKMKEKQKEHDDKPIDYAKLNKLYEYFVPQTQLSTEQVYWSPVSKHTPPVSVVKPTPTKVFPKKLLTTVNELKQLLAKFKGKIHVTTSEAPNLDSRIQSLDDENVLLAFKVSSFEKEREHLKLVYKNLYDSIKQTRGRVGYTNASGSQPKNSTRNDMIQQPSSRSKKNKLESQHRKFKSSSNKNNHVSDCNAKIVEIVLCVISMTISTATLPSHDITEAFSTTINQDAPSPSTTPTTETTTLIQSTNVEEPNNEMNDAKFDSDTFTIPSKYDLENSDVVNTPMVERAKLDEDTQGNQVNPTRFRSMFGSLMYLTSSHPDLVFDVYTCSRYQAKPSEKHLTAVK
ncbi:hypothetical protein Tco_1493586 [Tanacetum coccineum]